MSTKPILCLDFDGVIHSYASGWQGADVVSDPMVPGAVEFLMDAQVYFDVQIFSSRSSQVGGIAAMHEYIRKNVSDFFDGNAIEIDRVVGNLRFPTTKPSAFLTIDDRTICFDGTWPNVALLRSFRPWNKR